MIAEAQGALDEMGWNEADQPDRVSRTAGPLLLLVVAGGYWGALWLLSGFAPLVYLATRARLNRAQRNLGWRHRSP